MEYKENPERIISGRIGSRKDQTTVYNLKNDVQVVCGCFKGNIKEFLNAVDKVHGNNKYGKEYKEFIAKVKMYWVLGD